MLNVIQEEYLQDMHADAALGMLQGTLQPLRWRL
jgi:hypothetical protein